MHAWSRDCARLAPRPRAADGTNLAEWDAHGGPACRSAFAASVKRWPGGHRLTIGQRIF
ncbi:hypothetical protein F01_270004 [Burkholderia cenocepacia]|nr:hypothetical protein F01_270004 [Burkholderia cenocepacia]